MQFTKPMLFVLLYCLGIIALLFYSFTQIDLSLTLSQSSLLLEVQRYFQYIGYFNRPVSTYLFIVIIALLYVFYSFILLSIKHFSKKTLWFLILFTTLTTIIAYNAFSYDLFNYIFDAKIVTYYTQNPYQHKALDYPQDPMLSFMHWTHRVYPYGPVWLGLTVPLSYIGMQYFLLTFFLFKIAIGGFFIGTVWCISRILQKTSPQYEKFGMVFFALNPLVLIESVLSAHIDIVMVFFFMLATFFLVQKRYITTFLLLLLGYGVKFASQDIALFIHLTIIMGMAVGLFIFSKIQKKLDWAQWFLLASGFMIIPIVLASMRTNFQPWYLLSLIPFVALSHNIRVAIPVIIISLFALCEYIPFLYLGNWDPPVPTYLLWIRIGGIGIAIITFIALVSFGKRLKK